MPLESHACTGYLFLRIANDCWDDTLGIHYLIDSMKQVARMKVIQGGAIGVSPWLSFPQRIRICSQDDRTVMRHARISGEFPLKAARASRRQPAFELWSCLLKRPPPINNIECAANQPTHEGLTALDEAHACFKGLKRPIAEDDNGENWLTYVLRPSFFYRFDNSHAGAMVCVGRRLPVASDLLFLAHVRLDHPCDGGEESLIGALTHWGFAEISDQDAFLPAGYDSRFHTRMW